MEGQSSGRKGKSVVSEDLENEIDEAESENSESGFMESDNEIGDVDDEGLVFASKKHLTEAVLEYSRRNRCLRVIKNRNLTAKSIAKKYLHKFIADPKYSSTLLKQDLDMEYMTDVSLTKCTRAREWALQTVFGNWRDQYEKIYEYLAELRHTNSGTITICYLDLRLFQRMYVCLEACKLGYKSECRPIISVDGCHLKGYYGGHILAVVGIDANDCIYPIAYAVVESEYEGSWCWFLELFLNDLEITNSYRISFMLDRQDGLMEAIVEKFPNGEHRTCVRHLYTNFKSKHTDKTLKDLFWKVARSTNVNEYNAAMTEMEKINSDANKWCWPKPAGCNKFQVQHGLANQHTVDLDSTTCSCRKWDLIGVPCCHAISCILMIHGPNQWSPVLDMEPILPPQLRRPPGRPHKVRKKEADEPLVSGKVGKKGETKRCRKCGKKGHNDVRTCKGVAVGCNPILNQNFRCLKQPVTSSTQQPPMKKLPIKRKLPPTELPPPTIVRWMPTPRICSETGHVTISMDQGTISSSPATQEPPTK
ncbi:hypothetical protein V6N13_048926 [Hibiscus sabdariffa]